MDFNQSPSIFTVVFVIPQSSQIVANFPIIVIYFHSVNYEFQSCLFSHLSYDQQQLSTLKALNLI